MMFPPELLGDIAKILDLFKNIDEEDKYRSWLPNI